MPAGLHLREQVDDWASDHVEESSQVFSLKDGSDLRRLRRVCKYMTASSRAFLRDALEGYETLYLSLMPGSNALYQEGRWGRFVETLNMLSALSIGVYDSKHNPTVAVALSLPLTEVFIASSERVAA